MTKEMNYTIKFYKTMLKVSMRDFTKPFYASDYGLNGGEINSLHCGGAITPTGKTKDIFVPVDYFGEELYRKCEVMEWKFNSYFVKNFPRIIEEMRDDVNQVLALINDLHKWLGV